MKIKSLFALGAAITVTTVSAWAQLPNPANLELWFKADTGVSTNTIDGHVSNWADQSGNGYDAKQNPFSALAPLYVPNAQNGLPVIRFNGTFTYLAITNHVDLTAGLSIFIVAKNTARQNYNGLFSIRPSTTFPLAANNGNLSIYWQAGSTDSHSGSAVYAANDNTYPAPTYADITSSDVGPAVNRFYLYDTIATASAATQRVNNVNNDAYTPGTFTPLVANPAVIGVGYAGGGTVALNGDLAEIIVYNTALSTGDRQIVLEYLYEKWSIPEPSTVAYLLLSALGFVAIYRRRP